MGTLRLEAMGNLFPLLFFLFGYFDLAYNQFYDCVDSVQYALKCPMWAQHNECVKSYAFMKENCQKSCNFCQSKHDVLQQNNLPFQLKSLLNSETSGRDKSLGCPKPQWRGDGNCDDENNIESCNFDGGDCCGPNVVKKYCLECHCHNVKEDCGKPLWATDEYCDDENNNGGCNYDGGACCGPNVNKEFCKDCKCHLEESSEMEEEYDYYDSMDSEDVPKDTDYFFQARSIGFGSSSSVKSQKAAKKEKIDCGAPYHKSD